MLLRYLMDRRKGVGSLTGAESEAFRWRGEGVSRIEGLSDTVFGFAITLLVVSLDVPKTSGDLLTLMSGFLPFVASFAVLFALWRAQFEFFRRYGLEDKTTVRLTGLLLIGVLFAIYPVKFLFTFILLVLPSAMLNGHPDTVRSVMKFDHLPRVLALYGAGFLWINLILSRMYTHAYAQRTQLGLTELEAFDTRSAAQRWLGMSFLGAMIVVWCLVVLATRDHLRARDDTFWTAYLGGLAVITGASIWVRLRRRATTLARRELVDRQRGQEVA